MLTTTLAIRAVLAVLLSAASLTALLRDPAAAMPLPTSAEAAAAPPAEAWNGVQPSARHTAVGNFDLAYAVNDALVVPARVCR